MFVFFCVCVHNYYKFHRGILSCKQVSPWNTELQATKAGVDIRPGLAEKRKNGAALNFNLKRRILFLTEVSQPQFFSVYTDLAS